MIKFDKKPTKTIFSFPESQPVFTDRNNAAIFTHPTNMRNTLQSIGEVCHGIGHLGNHGEVFFMSRFHPHQTVMSTRSDWCSVCSKVIGHQCTLSHEIASYVSSISYDIPFVMYAIPQPLLLCFAEDGSFKNNGRVLCTCIGLYPGLVRTVSSKQIATAFGFYC